MTNEAKLNLVVIYVRDIEESRGFYSELGLFFEREQHGKGPAHYAASVGTNAVLELYPASDNNISKARLGFTVDSLSETLACLAKSNARILSDIRKSAWGTRAVVEDPNGNRVELLQAK